MPVALSWSSDSPRETQKGSHARQSIRRPLNVWLTVPPSPELNLSESLPKEPGHDRMACHDRQRFKEGHENYEYDAFEMSLLR